MAKQEISQETCDSRTFFLYLHDCWNLYIMYPREFHDCVHWISIRNSKYHLHNFAVHSNTCSSGPQSGPWPWQGVCHTSNGTLFWGTYCAAEHPCRPHTRNHPVTDWSAINQRHKEKTFNTRIFIDCCGPKSLVFGITPVLCLVFFHHVCCCTD